MVHMVQKRNIRNEIILALLKEKQLHLRAISKFINCPHSTVQREIINLKNRVILNYNSVGKNKIISIKKGAESLYIIYQAEYYKTSKFLESHPEFSVLIEKLFKIKNIDIIILFGSYTKGLEKKDSDIDLFVETNSRIIREEIKNINSRLNIKIGKFDKETPLGREIIKNHIIMKGVELFYEKNPIFD